MTRGRLALAVAFAVAEAAGALLLIVWSDHQQHKVATAVLALTAGISFVASGLVALRRRPENRTGVYLAAVGYLWFLGALTSANSDAAFTAGMIVGNLAFVPFAALVLAFPTGRLASRLDRGIVQTTLAFVIVGPLSVMLVDDQPLSGCAHDCQESAIVVYDSRLLADVLNGADTVFALALIAVVVAQLVRRWRSASPALRHTLLPVFLAGGAALVALLVVNLVSQLSTTVADALSPVFLVAFAAVPFAFLLGILRSRLARGSVARLVVSIGEGTPLRDAIAEALGDPSLELAYWSEPRERYLDREGRRFDLPGPGSGRSSTPVRRDGREVGALVHDESLAHEPELVESVAAAVALALDNERLQSELRGQLDLLATIVDTAPSLLVTVDTSGRIVNLNRATLEASGHDDEADVLGRFFWDVLIDPREREAMIGRFEEAAPEFAAAEYENAFPNARGEALVIAWRSAPLRDEAGKVVGIIAGGIDVTERKRRESELQWERDATNTLVQTIPTLVVVVDEHGSIVSRDDRAGVNRALRETLGWRDADLVGLDVFAVVEPDECARVAIEAAAAGTPSAELESRWHRPDGSSLLVAWTATPFQDTSGLGRRLALLSGTDVTQRKQQEEEVRASRARIVAAADEERRRLERNLHDGAQQRLVALSLSLRLAQSKVETDATAAAEILAHASDELAQALEDLRELARGIHPAVLTDRGLPAALEALAARMPLPVELTPADRRLPEPIEAAAYYVVAESIANVVKHAEASEVSVEVRADDGRLVVEVVDDGVGGADATRGSGLRGLADRLAALDGELRVESPAAGGTRVVATIPLERPAP